MVARASSVASAAAFLAATALAASSSAADLRVVDGPRDASATLATEATTTPGPGRLQVGAWFAAETHALTFTHAGTSVEAIGARLTMHTYASIGVGTRLAFGAAIPMVLTQGSGGAPPIDGVPVESASIGAVSLTSKLSLLQPNVDALGGASLALGASVDLPTAPRPSVIAEEHLAGSARAIASYDYGHLLIATAALGYRLRGGSVDLPSLTLGDAITWGATLAFRLQPVGLDDSGAWTLLLESHGALGVRSTSLLSDKRVDPIFLGGGFRYVSKAGIGVFGGVDLSLIDAVGAPQWRGVLGVSMAPPPAESAKDEDGDGVPDALDQCPGLLEDHLGPHPNDGCPDDSTARAPHDGGRPYL